MSLVARRATNADAAYLATRLLPTDAAEVKAASGLATIDALLGGIELSMESHVLCPAHEMDKPIVISGLQATPDPLVGAAWMLCGEGVLDHRIAFLRESKRWYERYNKQFPVIWNLVDERNTAHLRFLQWHGAIFINRHPHWGRERRPFLEFVRCHV